MGFGKKVPYKHKSVAQAFGSKAGQHTGKDSAINANDSKMTATPSSNGNGGDPPKFGFPTKGRTEANLKQADPDSSPQDETYPFPGRQAGQGRSSTINNQKPNLGNFSKAPIPAGGKGNLLSQSAPRSLSAFFGPAVGPKKISLNFQKPNGGTAPPNKGFSPTKTAKSPAQDFGERSRAPRKIARSFGG